MGNPTETYVDPSIAGDSGAGTVGDPYGDLQYALDTITRDSTNGDRINIKAGTDEILAAAIDYTTYGTPTSGAPLIFEGYTSAAGDGGIGGISGNAGNFSISAAKGKTYFRNLHLHNTGSAVILNTTTEQQVVNCEIDNGADGINAASFTLIADCHIHNISGYGIQASQGSFVLNNYLENAASDFAQAIKIGFWCIALNNTISVDGSSDGIDIYQQERCSVIGNTVWSNGGTGQGIIVTGGVQSYTNCIIANNIVEGFSGVGGVGFDITSPSIYRNNAAYNNTTNYDTLAWEIEDSNNETLSSSPFADASNGDFTVSTDVKATAWPTDNYPGLSVRTYLDKGALQREEAGAAGGEGPLIGGRLVR